jgi:excisionase family DNA binding protein
MVSRLVKNLPPLVHLKEAASFLGVNEGTIRRWVREGRIRCFKTAQGRSGHFLIPREEIARFLEEGIVPVPFAGR